FHVTGVQTCALPILFYFNPVDKDVPLVFFEKLNCKIWSFDKEDCKKYNLYYNNQFVVKENYNNKTNEITTDVLFVGSDKGRLDRSEERRVGKKGRSW